MTKRPWSGGLLICWGVATVLAGGCSEGPSVSTSKTEATVKGKVSIQGKPVSGGQVIFNPANYLRKDVQIRTAPIGKDGAYSITTLIGDNSISATGPELKQHGHGTEVMVFSVVNGENTFDIDFKPNIAP